MLMNTWNFIAFDLVAFHHAMVYSSKLQISVETQSLWLISLFEFTNLFFFKSNLDQAKQLYDKVLDFAAAELYTDFILTLERWIRYQIKDLPILRSFGLDWLLMTSTAHLAAIICCTASILIGPHSWRVTSFVPGMSEWVGPPFGFRVLCFRFPWFLGPDENRLSGGAGGRRLARREGNVSDNKFASSLRISSASCAKSGGWCKLTRTPES